MAFVYPAFLFSLVAVAVPILLHLIQLRRAKRVVFSNVKFIQVSKDITSSQKTLKELLILLCRILFIVFLVLAFAQPFLPAFQQGATTDNSDVAILVDNSFSAQNLQADQDYSVLTGAVERGKSIVNLFPASTAFSVVSGKNYSRGKAMSTSDAKVHLDDLDYSAVGFPSLTSSIYKPSHVFILSDYQKQSFRSDFLQRFDSLAQVHVVPIAAAGNSNVAVDSVYLEDEFIRGNTDNMLHVRIRNTGSNVLEDVPVKLFVNESQVAALSIDLLPKQATEAILNFKLQGNEPKQAYVQVDDFPVDFDNTYYFTLSPSSSISVTEITDDKSSPLQQLFINEPLFRFSSFSTSNPDYAKLASSDVVILNGIKDLPASLAATVSNYVKSGGTVLVTPGVKANAGGYTTLFQGLNVPATITSASDQASKTALAAPDPNQPFFKNIFSGYDARMTMPLSTRQLVWSKSSDDILKFKGGAPYLSRFDRGNGKVYLLAAPLEEEYNTLVNNALFVPIMYKLAISGYKQEQALAYTLGGGTVRIPVKEAPATQGVYELQQDSVSFIPEQQVRGGSLYFSVPADLNKAGFYTLKLQDKPVTTLAFNYSKSESELDQYTPDELRALIGDRDNVHVYNYGDAFSVKGEFEKKYFGVKLWKYCLILCLFFLMAEIALIRFL
ncbi:BatA domain-containing protein [Pontibacter cellulosilyticus]|uniref:BatA domain-containing protein n=1 Tax=Pontibacter cellulosilyticus TaxID=1720253 RepID=A0A923N9H0_9BACT|nr:BatA domain-containing protein [Pontibacter cellulosilyticus]MBC5994669.1 BatA domain-containing protein [Pontibacter cellulosilyticus]